MIEISIFWFLKILSALIAVITAILLLFTAVQKARNAIVKKTLIDDEFASQFVSQFNETEISEALSGYIQPYYSPTDPSNKDGEEYIPDTRENLFSYLDRQISESNKTFNLIMADTGMGKTAFCLNYFAHLKNKKNENRICILSMSQGDALSRIKKIKYKYKSIIILDAFDEDRKASGEGFNYLDEVLKQCADFRATIVTCRSQFFLGEEHIPRETSFPRIVPRSLGQSTKFTLTRGFIAPFDRAQIDRYIRSHFPRWNPFNYYSRQKAYMLARDIPDLSYRPMLLERLPHLIGSTESAIELFDLYDVLVEGWIKREETWIAPDSLRDVSLELAFYIYDKSISDAPRISIDEVRKVAEMSLGRNPEWDHLHSRSLLNRDSQGRFKFAHRSILEFLIVKLAIRGDARPLEVPWTPFMKELLVSWGHARNDRESAEIAKTILASENGKKNIAPLYDMWSAPPAFGVPDFSRAAQRRIAFTGDRLAPHTWRASAIVLENPDNPEVWEIHDTEFNLRWQLIDNAGFKNEGITETYNDLISVVSSCDSRQLPSYDQFLSLVDGLFHAGRDLLIPEGDCFLLADEPESGLRLVARLGKNLEPNKHLELRDKERRVGMTDRYVSAYFTGLNVSLTYAKNLKVRQLWLLAR